jgi:hypothetical protein
MVTTKKFQRIDGVGRNRTHELREGRTSCNCEFGGRQGERWAVGGGRGGADGSWVDGQVSGKRNGVRAGNNGEPRMQTLFLGKSMDGGRTSSYIFFILSVSTKPNAKQKNQRKNKYIKSIKVTVLHPGETHRFEHG